MVKLKKNKLSYTPKFPEEKEYFSRILVHLNPAHNELLQNDVVAEFFKKSELSADVLQGIWKASVHSSQGLRSSELFTMLRCIALAQRGKEYSGSSLHLSDKTNILPMFLGFDEQPSSKTAEIDVQEAAVPKRKSLPARSMATSLPTSQQQGVFFAPQNLAAGDFQMPANLMESTGFKDDDSRSISGNPSLSYSMSSSSYLHYRKVFRQLVGNGDKLDGKDSVSFFVKSGLDRSELRQVWNLADIDKDGKLGEEEFCIAMHLIVCRRHRNLPIPETLPAEFDVKQGKQQPAQLAPPQMNPTMQRTLRSSMSLSVSNPVQSQGQAYQKSLGSESYSVRDSIGSNAGVSRQLQPDPSSAAQNSPMDPYSSYLEPNYESIEKARASSLNASSLRRPASMRVNDMRYFGSMNDHSQQFLGSNIAQKPAPDGLDNVTKSLAESNATYAMSNASLRGMLIDMSQRRNAIRQEIEVLVQECKELSNAQAESIKSLNDVSQQIRAEQAELELLRSRATGLRQGVLERKKELAVQVENLNAIRTERMTIQTNMEGPKSQAIPSTAQQSPFDDIGDVSDTFVGNNPGSSDYRDSEGGSVQLSASDLFADDSSVGNRNKSDVISPPNLESSVHGLGSDCSSSISAEQYFATFDDNRSQGIGTMEHDKAGLVESINDKTAPERQQDSYAKGFTSTSSLGEKSNNVGVRANDSELGARIENVVSMVPAELTPGGHHFNPRTSPDLQHNLIPKTEPSVRNGGIGPVLEAET